MPIPTGSLFLFDPVRKSHLHIAVHHFSMSFLDHRVMELSENLSRFAERTSYVVSTGIRSENSLSTVFRAFSVREDARLSLLGFEYLPLVL